MFWVYLVGGIVLVKFAILAYVQWRAPYRMKDDGGPVSGWGTPEG